MTKPRWPGSWRGIGIQSKYSYGEWDGEFTTMNVTFTSAAGVKWAGAVYTEPKSPLAFMWTVGPLAGTLPPLAGHVGHAASGGGGETLQRTDSDHLHRAACRQAHRGNL